MNLKKIWCFFCAFLLLFTNSCSKLYDNKQNIHDYYRTKCGKYGDIYEHFQEFIENDEIHMYEYLDQPSFDATAVNNYALEKYSIKRTNSNFLEQQLKTDTDFKNMLDLVIDTYQKNADDIYTVGYLDSLFKIAEINRKANLGRDFAPLILKIDPQSIKLNRLTSDEKTIYLMYFFTLKKLLLNEENNKKILDVYNKSIKKNDPLQYIIGSDILYIYDQNYLVYIDIDYLNNILKSYKSSLPLYFMFLLYQMIPANQLSIITYTYIKKIPSANCVYALRTQMVPNYQRIYSFISICDYMGIIIPTSALKTLFTDSSTLQNIKSPTELYYAYLLKQHYSKLMNSVVKISNSSAEFFADRMLSTTISEGNYYEFCYMYKLSEMLKLKQRDKLYKKIIDFYNSSNISQYQLAKCLIMDIKQIRGNNDVALSEADVDSFIKSIGKENESIQIQLIFDLVDTIKTYNYTLTTNQKENLNNILYLHRADGGYFSNNTYKSVNINATFQGLFLNYYINEESTV